MGLFDFFRGKGASKPAAGVDEKTLAKHAERVLDKRALSPDRFASIEYLCRLATPEAWRIVLSRFNFTVDPSITDREEKQYIFDSIVGSPEHATEAICEYLRRSDPLNVTIKFPRRRRDLPLPGVVYSAGLFFRTCLRTA